MTRRDRQSLIDDLFALSLTPIELDRLRAELLEPAGQQVFIETLLTALVDGWEQLNDLQARVHRAPAEEAVDRLRVAIVGQADGTTSALSASGGITRMGGGRDNPLNNGLEYLIGRIGTDVDVTIYDTELNVSILSIADAKRAFEDEVRRMKQYASTANLDNRVGNVALFVRKAPWSAPVDAAS